MTQRAAAVARGVFCSGLVGWAGISALRQFTTEPPVFMHGIDSYGLWIPNYHFFCPEPAQHDVNMLYRDTLADGTIEQWKEVVLTQKRRWSHMLFYSGRRLDKGMMDLSGELIKTAQISGNLQSLSLTRQYMALLNMVTYGVEHDSHATKTQYAFVRSAAYEPSVEPHSVFVSKVHNLPAKAQASRGSARTAGASGTVDALSEA